MMQCQYHQQVVQEMLLPTLGKTCWVRKEPYKEGLFLVYLHISYNHCYYSTKLLRLLILY